MFSTPLQNVTCAYGRQPPADCFRRLLHRHSAESQDLRRQALDEPAPGVGFFLERPRRVFSREQLLDAVWGYDIYVESRTVDVHIRRLRTSMNNPGDPDLIRTVRSAGYALEEAQKSRPPRGSSHGVAAP